MIGDEVQALFGAMAGMSQQQSFDRSYTNYLQMQQAGLQAGIGLPLQMMQITQGSNSTVRTDDPDRYQEPVKVDEFKQLSNHKFHDLLDKFDKLRSKVT
jgi:hypothetical protein